MYQKPIACRHIIYLFLLAMLLCLAAVGYRQRMLYREGVLLRIPGTACSVCCGCRQPVVHCYCILPPYYVCKTKNHHIPCQTIWLNRTHHNKTHIKFPISIKLGYRQRMLYCEGGPLRIPGTAYNVCCVSCHPCYPNLNSHAPCQPTIIKHNSSKLNINKIPIHLARQPLPLLYHIIWSLSNRCLLTHFSLSYTYTSPSPPHCLHLTIPTTLPTPNHPHPTAYTYFISYSIYLHIW